MVMATQFDHEKLDVYQTAVDWVALAQQIVAAMLDGNGHGPLADQLQRAASSITLNIAEGAGEFSSAHKARFYRIAKRSATECAAIVDVAKRRRCVADEHLCKGRSLLLRLVGMLVKLTKAHC
jgi:four helix bundle protein